MRKIRYRKDQELRACSSFLSPKRLSQSFTGAERESCAGSLFRLLQDGKLLSALRQEDNVSRCCSGPSETTWQRTRALKLLGSCGCVDRLHKNALVATAAVAARRCSYFGGSVAAACCLAGADGPLQNACEGGEGPREVTPT